MGPGTKIELGYARLVIDTRLGAGAMGIVYQARDIRLSRIVALKRVKCVRAADDAHDRLVREAQRIVGLYRDGRLVGFCRAVTDGVAFVYLADVYVLPEFRGRGLGVELVREMIENGPYADRKWLLHTEDAHGLYEKFGFAAPDRKVMERLP